MQVLRTQALKRSTYEFAIEFGKYRNFKIADTIWWTVNYFI